MKIWKKTLWLCVCAAMGLSLLCGCGKPATEGPKETEVPEEDSTLVYVTERMRIEGMGNSSFGNLYYCDGRFLVSSYGKIGERELEEDEVIEWEGQNWIYGYQLYWLDLSGALEPISDYVPLDIPTEGGESYSYVQSVLTDLEGNIVTMEAVSISYYDGPDDIEMYSDEWYNAGYYEYQHYEQHNYLRTLDETGAECKCISLDEVSAAAEGEELYFYYVAIGADGNYYLSSDQSVFIVDAEGAPLGRIDTENWIESLLTLRDGSVAVTFWSEGGEKVAVVDAATMTLGEPISTGYAYNTLRNYGGEYDLYYTDGSNLMALDFATGETVKVLNWINCDVENGNGRTGCILPDGRIVMLQSEWDDDTCTNELLLIAQVPASSVPQKLTLRYATQYLNYYQRRAVVQFNRASSDLRIEVQDYSEYNTEEDYSAGLTKLRTEIMAGKAPDIIDLSGLPYQQMAAAGLLLDLYPYLDSDPELGRDAILPSILTAMECDGKLCRSCDSFEINAVAGAPGVVGAEPGWTLADFRAALAGMPEGCEPFSIGTTRESILRNMLTMNMDELIDWSSGQCHFDAPIFRDILEFAAEFPESFDDENYEWSQEDDEYQRISSGRQMLLNAWIYDFESVNMYQALFGGDVCFVGYPVSSGVGNALSLGNGCAISSKCENPDAAWQFVRMLFTKDYQMKNVWELPTNVAAYNEKLKEAMTVEYQKDASGNYVLDENGERIPVLQGSWGYGEYTVDFYALSQEQADAIRALIDSTTRVSDSYDEEILEIILQDTAAYFAGQKSLDDVVKQLQSKMNIYINEQR